MRRMVDETTLILAFSLQGWREKGKQSGVSPCNMHERRPPLLALGPVLEVPTVIAVYLTATRDLRLLPPRPRSGRGTG